MYNGYGVIGIDSADVRYSDVWRGGRSHPQGAGTDCIAGHLVGVGVRGDDDRETPGADLDGDRPGRGRVDHRIPTQQGESEHWVPLCRCALEILDEARTLVEGTSPYLLPNRVGQQLDETQLRWVFQKHRIAAVPHGVRSCFRDWAAVETNYPREVIEAALAHVAQSSVEAAYRCTDLFERRQRGSRTTGHPTWPERTRRAEPVRSGDSSSEFCTAILRDQAALTTRDRAQCGDNDGTVTAHPRKLLSWTGDATRAAIAVLKLTHRFTHAPLSGWAQMP